MTNKLNNLSLVTILGLGACAGSRQNFKPWVPFFKGEPNAAAIDPSKKPSSNQGNPKFVYGSNNIYQGNNDEWLLHSHNRDLDDLSFNQANFDSYVTGLPVPIVDRATSLDLGVAKVAASGDSILVRPLYSQVYEMSLDNDLRLRRYLSRNDSFSSPAYFDTAEDSFGEWDDDPEKYKRDEGIAISNLLKWAWDWDVFSPLRNTANQVRSYSNEVVKHTLGSNTDLDYTGRRIVLGYNVPIDRFYLEFDLWTDITNLDQSGIAIHMALPFGTRR